MTTTATTSTSPIIATLLCDLDGEIASTRKILERYPDGRGSWQPHTKSRTIGQLAAHVAALPALGTWIITTDTVEATTRPPLPELDKASDLVAFFDARAGEFRKALSSLDDSQLDNKWSLTARGQAFINMPKRQALRIVFMNHMIHHRAQLGVYFRLLDVAVPIVYGPTADEAFG